MNDLDTGIDPDDAIETREQLLITALESIIYVAKRREGPAAMVVLPHIIQIAQEALDAVQPDEHADDDSHSSNDWPF